ncbi:MAG TPA: hypothetical protein PLH15_10565 [Spirochaetota bacterium]|mgnify:CR=1 FL=1|nr:hypothetical protein [Spirochaetota bacterium]HQQ24270.1 hypothetical protein [Spirochaetota bacterium]
MELINSIEKIEQNITQRFNRLILEIEKEAKKLVSPGGELAAYDTGDMRDAISHELAKREGVNLTGTIFVNIGKLYNKRKQYQYKRGARKGSYAKANRNYPVYVHDGTQHMKARPFFLRAFQIVKQRPEFQHLAVNTILSGSKE